LGGVFGFDIEFSLDKERVEELPGLVKRQKNISADTKAFKGAFAPQAIAA
jgi:hypothetical protein